jgi:glycosyltransferase involved in cell wall biosynthesis
VLAQDYPTELWRLSVVDNASTDDTLEIALGLERRFDGRVRALRCARLGHSAARNAAVTATSSDIVAFTDDDALPDPTWLTTLVRVMEREGAEAGGGPVDLVLSGELPPWFLESYLPYLAIWNPSDQTVALTYNEYPRGVNLAYRRDVFERVGLFSPHLGLRGTRQRFCEETELCLRIERTGGRVVFSQTSRVRHCVDSSRFSAAWLARRFAAQGRSEAILNWMHGGFRGLALGSGVHFANLRAATPTWSPVRRSDGPCGVTRVAPRSATAAERHEAAAILTHCRRRALLGYVRQAPLAIATVPRYRPPSGAELRRWTPPDQSGATPMRALR